MLGGIFSEQARDGRATADVTVTQTGVEAITRDGNRFSLDADQCHLDLGGASGRMWFVRSPDRALTIFCEAPEMERALLEVPALRARVEALQVSRKRSRRQGLWLWAGLGVLLLLASWGAYEGLAALSGAAVTALPTSADAKLGKIAIESMDLGGEVVKTPVVVDGVSAIVAHLTPHAQADDWTFHVQVVASDQVNAFALPGGEIVVYTGLLRAADSPEQVAAVLAHEMAHVTLRHGMARIAHAVGLTAALDLVLGDVAGLSGLVLELARSGALTHHDRDQERAADARGAKTLAAAGIDPTAMASFFGTMAAAEQGEDLPTLDMPAWLASHPDLEERQRTIAALAAELGAVQPQPLGVDWKALRDALGDRAADTPDLNRAPPPGDDGPAATPEPDAD